MSELRLIADHLRLDYSGPFVANDLFKHTTSFFKERGYDLKIDKEFEHTTANGKQIEWQIKPWKRITDNSRYWPKIRILISDYKKVDAVVNKKKVKVGNGKVVAYIDAYLELDEQNRWDVYPIFQFIRTLYHNFFYRIYTERFEQRLSFDVHNYYDSLEKLFNLYRSYKVVSKVPPFVSVG